jgi:hypothetical protein
MKIFVVNQVRDMARLASADGQLRRYDIQYERVSAICGDDLSRVERRVEFYAFRWWCTMTRIVASAAIWGTLSYMSFMGE